jgi:hypothetical protein
MKEEEIVLRIKRNQRVGVLIFAIIFPIALIGMFFLFVPSSTTIAEYIREIFSIGFGWYLVSATLFLTGLMTYSALQTWHDRLVFTDSQLERRGIPHPRIYKGPTPYEDIVRVRRGSIGVLVLDTSQGKKYLIATKSFEGGPNSVLDQLRAHIPEERFEEDLEGRLYQRVKAESVALVVAIIGLILFIAGQFFDEIFERIRSDVAWHLAVEGNFMEDIESYALSEDGSLWILVQKSLGDYSDPANYQVRHLISGDEEILSIPSMEILYPDGPPEIGFTHPVGILLTEEGLPRLYFDSIQPELIWTGSVWERGPQPDPRETYIEQLARVTGDPYWETLNDHGKILVMDTKLGVETEVDLGPSDDPYRVIYHGTSDDWKIVQMDGEPRRYFLMRFKEPGEPKIWFEIDYSSLLLSEYWHLMDYTVDADGVFFVLIRNIPYCVEDTATHFVGKLDPSGGDWVWRTLQHPDRCDGPEGDRQILIDVRGRVWLTGEEVVVAFEPNVFDSERIERNDYVLYSEYNSGYYEGHSLKVGPDKRIWTLGILGEGLVWIDPDVDALEKPLPDWIHEMLSSTVFKVVADFGGLLIMVIALLMVYYPVVLGKNKGGDKKN